MQIENFRQLAAYNHWANARLYAAAFDLADEAYRRPVGVFFGSLHATLNHLVTTDRLWLRRLTGDGPSPNRLNEIVHEDLGDLWQARVYEDDRIERAVAKYDEAGLAAMHDYQTTSGQPQQQRLGDILLHVFNHQTHHRGQAHACCSIVSPAEPPSLDLLLFQRGLVAPDVAKRVADHRARNCHR